VQLVRRAYTLSVQGEVTSSSLVSLGLRFSTSYSELSHLVDNMVILKVAKERTKKHKLVTCFKSHSFILIVMFTLS
jgi:hypothetical protein